MTTTGIGLTHPLFFMGVVENNYDERLEGRVQVRAFGIHGMIGEVPTADLPWAILCIGNHDVNFTVPPINAWVFGCFIDGRDAQQPIILGLIPTQMTAPVNPEETGWGVAFGTERNLMAQGSRPQDAGQPQNSRLMRGENLEETYLLPMEVNRKRSIPIAGGSAPNLSSVGNLGISSQDDGQDNLSAPEAPPPAGTIPGNPTTPVPKSERSDYIKAGLMKRGMKEHIADGMLMNMYDESKLDPGIEEYALNVHGTRGFGLIQWTDTSPGVGRRTNLQRFAASQGKPANDLDVQMDFLMTELNGPEKKNWGIIQNTTTAGEAGAAIVDKFLRPRADHKAARIARYTGGQGYAASQGVTDSNYAGGYKPPTGSEPVPSAVWEEPAPAYGAQYPHNRVIETAAGHSIEIDDTPNNERIHIWHKSGSYIQLASGTVTHKSVGDKYSVNDRNHHVYIGGTNVVTIEGDSHILVKGNLVEEIQGNYKQIVHGNSEITAAGQVNIIGGEDANIRAARVSMESNVENTNIKVGKVLRFETTETMHFKTKNMYFETTETLNMKSGTDFILNATGKLSMASDAEAYLAGTEIHIKADDVKIGGGDAVNINASAVNIDDVVNMANGESSEPEESELVAPAAEPATVVTRPAPPARSFPETVVV